MDETSYLLTQADEEEAIAELREQTSHLRINVRLLNDAARNESDDAGPETELEYWRTRMAKFNAITEQLKGRECKIVLGVIGAAKSKVLKRWKTLDNSITDANNEAKDNVKYLSTLEKYIEPLRSGTPETCLLYTSPSPRDATLSRMPSSA